MSLPRISVITPSFNQAKFLEKTIESVLSQGYPNLEYIVIDGGSTDGSVEILERWSDKLTYWISEPDSGHGEALNKGFARSTGDLMCWLNSDDMYYPWTLEVVAEIFAQFQEVEWIVGFNTWWNDRGQVTFGQRAPKNIFDYLIGNFGWIQQESVFWRRPLWNRVGAKIDQSYKLMVDGELWSRFFLEAPLYTIDCALAGYRVHGANRAGAYYEQCVVEMHRAIADMELRCSSETLSTANRLRTAKRLATISLLRHLPVSQVASRLLSSDYERASYHNLTYRGGRWQTRRIPFTVTPNKYGD